MCTKVYRQARIKTWSEGTKKIIVLELGNKRVLTPVPVTVKGMFYKGFLGKMTYFRYKDTFSAR